MSIRVISIVWDRYPEGGSKLLTMLALADWASDDGSRVYPSMDTLASKIRMSRRQAVRVIHELVEAGFLALLNPENAGGRGKTNQYQVRLETLSNCHSLILKGDKSAETMTPGALKGDIAMSHEPLGTVIEPGGESTKTLTPSKADKSPDDSKALLVQSILDRSTTIDEKNTNLEPLGLWIDRGGVNVMEKETDEIYRVVREPVKPDNKQLSSGD